MESTGVYWKSPWNILEEHFPDRHDCQCGPYEARCRPEDRQEGCRVDCRALAAGAAQTQLYPISPSTRASRSDSLADDHVTGTDPVGESAAQNAGRYASETRVRCSPRAWVKRGSLFWEP